MKHSIYSNLKLLRFQIAVETMQKTHFCKRFHFYGKINAGQSLLFAPLDPGLRESRL